MKLQDNILESLKEQFTDLISNENVMVLKASDYQDERIPFMVIVGIDEYQVINVGCKDYRLTLKVVIDFFIEDDKEGYFFNQTRHHPSIKQKQKSSLSFGRYSLHGPYHNTVSLSWSSLLTLKPICASFPALALVISFHSLVTLGFE